MNHTKQTRRDFLKVGAGVAAAHLAAPYVFSGATAEAADAAAGRINVAAIGTGGRGSEIGEFAAKLCNIVACADAYLDNARSYAGRLDGKCQVYQDYRRVLDRQDVEAVLIATPDHWHTKIAIDAMKAGKDVYCEKPLTLTIDEGSLICKATKETGRVFQVGTQQRSSYDGCFLETVAIARSGRLGNRLLARCTIGGGVANGPFPVADPPRGLDWDLWLGQAPQVPFCAQRGLRGSFRQWLDYAGGITDWGAHHIDIALWALGGENTGVVEVAGKGEFPLGRQLTLDYLLGKKSPRDLPNGSNVATAFDCTMKLPNGNAIAFVSGDHDDIFIAGQEAHLAVNRNGIRGKFVEALKRDAAEKAWLDREVDRLYRGKPRRGHMANFLDCVKDRSLPISDVFTHRNSINACHMANIAMLLGRKIQWSPGERRFVGDDEANRLTRRTQRKPYLIAEI